MGQKRKTAASHDGQEAPKPFYAGLLGCLWILAIILVLLGLPFLAHELLAAGRGTIAWPFLGMGFALFGLMALGAVRSGRLPAKGRAVLKSANPVAYYTGLVLYSLCALAMYVFYILSLFG